jgi:hypothetical protein
MSTLKEFFKTQVKGKTWENGVKPVKLDNGDELIQIEDVNGEFIYTDTWSDDSRGFFAGSEVIQRVDNIEILWKRCYEGTAFPSQGITQKMIWAFLKEALATPLHTDEMRNRGPIIYTRKDEYGEWDYGTGFIAFAKEMIFAELIFLNSRLVYQGIYSVHELNK